METLEVNNKNQLSFSSLLFCFPSPPSQNRCVAAKEKVRIHGTRWQWDLNPRPPGPHVKKILNYSCPWMKELLRAFHSSDVVFCNSYPILSAYNSNLKLTLSKQISNLYKRTYCSSSWPCFQTSK